MCKTVVVVLICIGNVAVSLRVIASRPLAYDDRVGNASAADIECSLTGIPQRIKLVLKRQGEICDGKTLIATRHAEARHNVAEAWAKADRPETYPGLRSDEIKDLQTIENVIGYEGFFDAPLSAGGVAMASSVGRANLHLALQDSGHPHVVYVSPLRRTLLTAAILYGGEYRKPLYATDLIVEKRTQTAADTRRSLQQIESGLELSGDPNSANGFQTERELRVLFVDPATKHVKTQNLGAPLQIRFANAETGEYKQMELKDGPQTPRDFELGAESLGIESLKGGLVGDEFYFGKQQDGASPLFKEDMPTGNSETLDRAKATLLWLVGLDASLPSVGLVSHKGFLRELEIAGGLYEGKLALAEGSEVDAGYDAKKQRTALKSFTSKDKAFRKQSGEASGEYGNAETRTYCLKIQEIK